MQKIDSEFLNPPVFQPTKDEFDDPLAYISKISKTVYNFGICKIRPPSDWKPSFAASRRKFDFTPRLQNLSEVSPYNRVRVNFLNSLISFWEAQDVKLFTPHIRGKALDLFKLWKCVESNGGYAIACERKLWCNISQQLDFSRTSVISSAIRTKYEKLLLPYKRFKEEQRQAEESKDAPTQFEKRNSPQKRKLSLERLSCTVCGLGTHDDCLLLCDNCNFLGACHTFCVQPPLSDVPKGKWYCRDCVTNRYKQLHHCEAYGFRPSGKKYTLNKFAAHADDFKVKHFGKPLSMISLDDCEAEFWRLVDSEDLDVVVEYGADLGASEFGSGFASSDKDVITDDEKPYISSSWNLNNLSVNERSALRFLPRDISGMIIPWCYVGMVFSCFCWHTEDHWSYSINYLHTGSPKTWYGIPSAAADHFEDAVRSEVPELFEHSPDLLHHMTTIISPSRLQSYGIPIYQLHQLPGEFVVTFPRAYHAGFNQGFNFAEAVNFCPADWFYFGQECIDHYALSHRAPVFSHAELLCRMAESQDSLNVDFLTVVTKQLRELLLTERTLRRHTARLGVCRTERLVFEKSEDEKRECDLCRTILFLSALACKCSPTMHCLAHHRDRTCCARQDQIMRYRYGLDELSDFIERLQGQLDEYHHWKQRVDYILNCKIKNTPYSAACHNSAVDAPAEHFSSSGLNDTADVSKAPSESTESFPNHCVKKEPDNSSIDLPVASKPQDFLIASENTDLSSPSSKLEGDKEEKMEVENEKPTLEDLQDLLRTGQTKQYPQSDIHRLNQFIHTASECSAAISSIMRGYHTLTRIAKNPSQVFMNCEKSLDRIKSDKSPVESSDSETERQSDSDTDIDDLSTVGNVCDIKPDRSPSSLVRGSRAINLPMQIDASLCESEKIEGPVISKLTLDEFQCLVDIASNLPIAIPELPELNAFVNELSSWRKRAQQLITELNKPSVHLKGTNRSFSAGKVLEGSLELASAAAVEEMLQFSSAVEIELPESKQLKRIHECVSWLECVDHTLTSVRRTTDQANESTPGPLLSRLCELQLQGDLVASAIAYVGSANQPSDRSNYCIQSGMPQTCLDKVLAECSHRLLDIIGEAKSMEAKLLSILNADPGTYHLETIRKELDRACLLNIQLPIIDDVKNLIDEAVSIDEQCVVMKGLLVATPIGYPIEPLSPHLFPDDLFGKLGLGTIECTASAWKSHLESIVETASKLPVTFSSTKPVEALIDTIANIREQLKNLFLWPQSKSILLEVLLPRPVKALQVFVKLEGGHDFLESYESVRSTSSRRSTKDFPLSPTTYTSLCKENARTFARAVIECRNAGELYEATYQQFVENEFEIIKQIRELNMAKSNLRNQNKVIYCVCRKPGFSGFMVQCDLCRDWFHGRCVSLPNLKDKEAERLRYICPRCGYSMRPDIDKVLTVLDDLSQHLSTDSNVIVDDSPFASKRTISLLRIPEFAAAHMLCERAFLFVRRLRSVINTNRELQNALYQYEQYCGVRMPHSCFDRQYMISDETRHMDRNYPMNQPRLRSVKTNDHSCNMPPGLSPHSDSLVNESKTSSKNCPMGRPEFLAKRLPSQFGRPYKHEQQLNESQTIYGTPRVEHCSDLRYNANEMISALRKQGRKAPLLARSGDSNRPSLISRNPTDDTAPTATLADASKSNIHCGPIMYQSTSSQQQLNQFSLPGRVSVPSTLTPLPTLSDAQHDTLSSVGSSQYRASQHSVDRDKLIGTPRHSHLGAPPQRRGRPSNLTARQTKQTDEIPTRSKAQPKPQVKFQYLLSLDAQHVLETLIMEASLLQVNIPQTRWLWQLHLASDPESAGTHRISLAKLEEEKLRERFLQRLQQSKSSKRTKRANQMPSNEVDKNSTCNVPSELDDASLVSSETGISDRHRSPSPSKSSVSASSEAFGISNRNEACRARMSTKYSPPVHHHHSRGASQNIRKKSFARLQNRYGHMVSTGSYSTGSNVYRKLLNQQVRLFGSPLAGRRGRTNSMSTRGRPRRARGIDRSLMPTNRLIRRALDNSPSSDNENFDSEQEERVVAPVRRARLKNVRLVGRSTRARGGRRRVYGVSHPSTSNRSRYRLHQNDEDEEYSEDNTPEDACAARAHCQHPNTGTVEWIECDDCKRWFHQICVGIRHKKQVPDTYFCPSCRRCADVMPEKVRQERCMGLSHFNISGDRSGRQRGMVSSRPRKPRQSNSKRNWIPLSGMDQRPIGWSASSTTGFDRLYATAADRNRFNEAKALLGMGNWSDYSQTSMEEEEDEIESRNSTRTSGDVPSNVELLASRQLLPSISSTGSYACVFQIDGALQQESLCDASVAQACKQPADLLLEAIDVVSSATPGNDTPAHGCH